MCRKIYVFVHDSNKMLAMYVHPHGTYAEISEGQFFHEPRNFHSLLGRHHMGDAMIKIFFLKKDMLLCYLHCKYYFSTLFTERDMNWKRWLAKNWICGTTILRSFDYHWRKVKFSPCQFQISASFLLTRQNLNYATEMIFRTYIWHTKIITYMCSL